MTNLDELVERIRENVEASEKFTAVVSNPPYQIDNQGENASRRSSSDIFPYFQETSCAVSNKTSMIYPATWQKDLKSGLFPILLKNGLRKSLTFRGEELFFGIIMPVSINYVERDYSGSININGRNKERTISIWLDSEKEEILFEKVKKFAKLSGGITNPLNIHVIDDLNHLSISTERGEDSVSFLVKKKKGKQPDSVVVYSDRKNFLKKYPNLDIKKNRVAVRSRILGRQSIFQEVVFNRRGGLGLQSRVFKPGELFGLTWGQIREFDDYNEAQNFSNYINTMIIARLAYLDYSRKTFGSFIPELNDYSDNNPLFQTDDELGENHEYFGLTLNERLYKLFKLTKDEIAIVENV